MQVLWREVFEGNHPLTVDEFLYCYKPSEINQSLGFYQFTTRGKDYRLINSLVTSDRNWKTEFFFISGFWARHPIEVDQDPFPPYTGELGNLFPEGMPMVIILLFIMLIPVSNYLKKKKFFLIGARRPQLSKFYVERVQKARLYTDRTFHFLVSLQRLTTWGLGLEPSAEAIAHELTIRRRKFSYRFLFPFPLSFSSFLFFVFD